jgi:5-methylcytosine-specific restriction endonuclease McrA
MNKKCQTCKKVFSKPYTESKANWMNHKFCSKECKKKFSPKVTLVCWECKGYFTVKNYRKNTAHFCSKLCAFQYRDEGKRTADKKARQSARYKAWRTLVFERDNYMCVHCGIKNGLGKTVYLHADHIKPFALYPELRYEVSNGRTLCVPCHKKTGTYGRGAIYRKIAVA